MTIDLTIWVALLSFAGIIAGAALQYVFTRVLEDRRHRRELRTQAYSDYVRGVSDLKHQIIDALGAKEREMYARLTDAKMRVTLYGSKSVIEKMADFERFGGGLHSDAQQEAFVEILIAMRDGKDAKLQELEVIMLGVRR